MNGIQLSYPDLRVEWSKLWNGVESGKLKTDTIKYGLFRRDVTPEDYIMLGIKVLKALCDRVIYKDEPEILLLDEPYSIELDDIIIEGRIDAIMAFTPRTHRKKKDVPKLWLVNWVGIHYTDYKVIGITNASVRQDIKYAVQIQAARNILGIEKPFTGILLDNVKLGRDEFLALYKRQSEIDRELKESIQIAKAVAQKITYRDLGAHCFNACNFSKLCYPNMGRKIAIKHGGELPVGVQI